MYDVSGLAHYELWYALRENSTASNKHGQKISGLTQDDLVKNMKYVVLLFCADRCVNSL